ncbi:MAG: hypothetical protein L0Y57_05350 [Beijerinckiaceae bacterium]|nr:hypothetical protein [Beijerinckiaceae bacterium]
MDWRERDAPRAPGARRAKTGVVRQAIAALNWRVTGLVLVALVILGAAASLQSARYSAEARLIAGPGLSGIIGLRASAAGLRGAAGAGAAIGQARLIASRDLARKVIGDLELADNLELDPAAGRLGLGSRTLIFLGVKRDPARKSKEERILEAFQERLRVSGPDRRGLVTIAFQSEDPELAAKTANRIAELYLDLRAHAGQNLPSLAAARIVSRASPPQKPVPRNAILFLAGTAMALISFGVLAALVLPHFNLAKGRDEPVASPLPLGEKRSIARVKVKERLSPRFAPQSDPPPHIAGGQEKENPEHGQAFALACSRLFTLRAEAQRGIRIFATYTDLRGAGPYVLIELARELVRGGRTIAVSLDSARHLELGSPAPGSAHRGALPASSPGLSDLIAGTASFSDVIRRDPASRLHLLPAGQSGELLHEELNNVLDTLAETYDFIVTLAPPAGQSDTAMIAAAKADAAVIAVPACESGEVYAAERQLIESGAGEILLLGVKTPAGEILGRDAA